MLGKCTNIFDHVIDAISGLLCRLIRLSVATLVDSDCIVILAELFQLESPTEPELGKAMHENDEFILGVTFGYIMQIDALKIDKDARYDYD